MAGGGQEREVGVPVNLHVCVAHGNQTDFSQLSGLDKFIHIDKSLQLDSMLVE